MTNLFELGETLEKVLSVPICRFTPIPLPAATPPPVKMKIR